MNSEKELIEKYYACGKHQWSPEFLRTGTWQTCTKCGLKRYQMPNGVMQYYTEDGEQFTYCPYQGH